MLLRILCNIPERRELGQTRFKMEKYMSTRQYSNRRHQYQNFQVPQVWFNFSLVFYIFLLNMYIRVTYRESSALTALRAERGLRPLLIYFISTNMSYDVTVFESEANNIGISIQIHNRTKNIPKYQHLTRGDRPQSKYSNFRHF